MSGNSKPVMLSLEPREELVFEGPFNRSVLKSLVIRNPSKDKNVAFKLKTTTPRTFFVRPNVGVLRPDEKVTVDIFMQPSVSEVGQKRHKFLVQAALASGDVTDLQEFWKGQKAANIWDTKIKCVIAPYKASEDNLRQAGGGATGSPDSKQSCEAEFEAKLVKQIRVLEDDRYALKKEIVILRDQGKMCRYKHRERDLFKFSCCILTIVAAIVGAYYGKHYL